MVFLSFTRAVREMVNILKGLKLPTLSLKKTLKIPLKWESVSVWVRDSVCERDKLRYNVWGRRKYALCVWVRKEMNDFPLEGNFRWNVFR